MAEETSKKNEKQPLRSVNDIVEAHEWLFQMQREGKIDPKSADAMNTTLKGQTYLIGKIRLDAAKLYVAAAGKKIQIPEKYLPVISQDEGERVK